MDSGLKPLSFLPSSWDALTTVDAYRPADRTIPTRPLKGSRSEGSIKLPQIEQQSIKSDSITRTLQPSASHPGLQNADKQARLQPSASHTGTLRVEAPARRSGRPPAGPDPRIVRSLRAGHVLLAQELEKLKIDYESARKLAAKDPEFARLFRRAQQAQDVAVRQEAVEAWYNYYKQRFFIEDRSSLGSFEAALGPPSQRRPKFVGLSGAQSMPALRPLQRQPPKKKVAKPDIFEERGRWIPLAGPSGTARTRILEPVETPLAPPARSMASLRTQHDVVYSKAAAAARVAAVSALDAAAAASSAAEEARMAAEEARAAVSTAFAEYQEMSLDIWDQVVPEVRWFT